MRANILKPAPISIHSLFVIGEIQWRAKEASLRFFAIHLVY
jgi:hypothetical protein